MKHLHTFENHNQYFWESYSLNEKKDFKEKHGIKGISHPHASIGFSEKEQKWYGWSHRAIAGFGIGSTVKRGDCAYEAANENDWIEDRKQWFKGKNVTFEMKTKKLIVTSKRKDNKDLIEEVELPKKFGKGEWKAKTLEDAKEMAIAFSRSVS